MAEYNAAPDRLEFREAMHTEAYQLLDKYNTLEHVSKDTIDEYRAAGRVVRVVPSKGVWKRKYTSDATVAFDRHKWRWCACEAVGRFDVQNTYSPAVSIESVRLLFTIAAIHGLELCSVDVAGALVGDRPDDEDVIFLRMPKGLDEVQAHRTEVLGEAPDPRLNYRDSRGREMYYRATKNLYGLQSAGAVFYRYAEAWLIDEMGFEPTSVDPCVFHKRTADGLTRVGLYVDDMLLCFENDSVKQRFIDSFKEKFDQSPDPGDNSFLSIAYRQNEHGVHLNIPKLRHSLEAATDGHTLPPALGSPLPHGALEMLSAAEDPVSNPRVPKHECDVRAILGIAMWGVLACRPAEAFACAAIARHAHRPTRNVVNVLLGFCSYLLHHRHDELTISSGGADAPAAYVDSSWGNNPSTNRSWFGYCIMRAGCPFSFRSKLEPCIALSSRDAEAIAAVFSIKSMLAVLIILSELGITPLGVPPMDIYIDNQPVVDNANSDKIHRDSRHMAMRLSWIRELVTASLIRVRKIATSANVADVFTKELPPASHRRFRAVLMGDAPVSSIALLRSPNGA
jgi:hypothetical protein